MGSRSLPLARRWWSAARGAPPAGSWVADPRRTDPFSRGAVCVPTPPGRSRVSSGRRPYGPADEVLHEDSPMVSGHLEKGVRLGRPTLVEGLLARGQVGTHPRMPTPGLGRLAAFKACPGLDAALLQQRQRSFEVFGLAGKGTEFGPFECRVGAAKGRGPAPVVAMLLDAPSKKQQIAAVPGGKPLGPLQRQRIDSNLETRKCPLPPLLGAIRGQTLRFRARSDRLAELWVSIPTLFVRGQCCPNSPNADKVPREVRLVTSVLRGGKGSAAGRPRNFQGWIPSVAHCRKRRSASSRVSLEPMSNQRPGTRQV